MGNPIPADVLFEILLLLPGKDLRRLESVSKSFSSIIHDAAFINCHLRRAIETNSSSTLISLLTLTNSNGPRGNILRPDDKTLICFSDLNSPGKVRRLQFENDNRVLSCNGLLCFVLSSDSYIAISNLVTKPSDYHMISIPPSVSEGFFTSSSPFYGFGYDSVTDDYKVLVMDVCISENHCYAETRVYSLRHNVWKPKERWEEIGTRESFPRIVNHEKPKTDSSLNGVVASCAFHWLAQEGFILAFNITTEGFSEVQLPDIVRDEKVCIADTRLGALKGCLSLCVGEGSWEPRYFDIWVMQDYNNHASWIKILHLDQPSSIITPISSRSEYEVLIQEEHKQRFCWYDLRKRGVIECVLDPLKEFGNPLHKYLVGNNNNNNNKAIFPKKYLFGNRHFFHSPTICLETLVAVNDYRALWGKVSKGRKRRRILEDEEKALESFVKLRNSLSA